MEQSVQAIGNGISFCIISGGKRPDRMEVLIQSIEKQQIPNYEILVCGLYRNDPRVRYLHAQELASAAEVCKMRNRCGEEAVHDTLIFLDDDVEFKDDWYTAISAIPSFDLVGCRVLDANGQRWFDWQKMERGNPLASPVFIDYNETDPDAYISGCFMMVRKAVWQSVRFDENRRNHQHDDIDFCHRVTNAGFSLRIFPQATVVHHVDGRGREETDRARAEFIERGAEPKNSQDKVRKLILQKRWQEAVDLLTDLNSGTPSFAIAYDLGYCFQHLGDRHRATGCYLQALNSPDAKDTRRMASAFLHLGELFLEDDRKEHAKESLKAALGLMPENGRARELLERLG